MSEGLPEMFILTLKFVNETDKDEALAVLEQAEMDGKIMGPFDTKTEIVLEESV